MSEIRCPRRACRRRKRDVVSKAFLVSDEGGLVYGPLARPHFVDASGEWHPITPYSVSSGNYDGTITVVADWDATRSVPAHFRCTCGHRYVHRNGRNETLRLKYGRVYDGHEVARLVKGLPAGWPRPAEAA